MRINKCLCSFKGLLTMEWDYPLPGLYFQNKSRLFSFPTSLRLLSLFLPSGTIIILWFLCSQWEQDKEKNVFKKKKKSFLKQRLQFVSSDGSYPKDEGSSQEVTQSLFVGESRNRGTNAGQNKYWGLGGADAKMRTLPRNRWDCGNTWHWITAPREVRWGFLLSWK